MRRALCIFALGLALLHPLSAAQVDPAVDGFVATGSFSMESTFLLWVDAFNEATKNKEQRIRMSMRPMTATQAIKEFGYVIDRY
ncbi:MAG TPA: hypothetical protein PKL14_11150 [Holophaga sp.]|nr:hypothetical protein [Holophaga sp.]